MHYSLPPHRCFAEIDTCAIVHNFHALSALLPAGVKTMAVVKANAYGHGAVEVARLLEKKADFFGVACLEEALELREAGICNPILILSCTSPAVDEILIREEISTTICTYAEGVRLAACAAKMGKVARVHIAVDTGMGRIGFAPTEEAADRVAALARTEGLSLEGVFSHYACADCEDLAFSHGQTAKFDSFLELLRARGVTDFLPHICNSAATLRFPSKYGMCRLGIALYGLPPSEETRRFISTFRPAMTVKSHVIYLKTVAKGTPIGYGQQYHTFDERRIATVGIGYGDGYNRCIGEEGYLLIHGKKAAICGKICMDQVMVDVTDIPETAVGDEAVVLGRSGEEEISAALLGKWARSFPYEVVCTFLPRVQRVFISKQYEKEKP